MTTFAFNPAVTNVDYSVVVSASELEKLGWDFDTNAQDLDIRLEFEGEKGKCFWAFCIDGSDREDSGDDNKSLEDLLYLISNNIIPYDENDDYSTDEDGHYCPWIIDIEDTCQMMNQSLTSTSDFPEYWKCSDIEGDGIWKVEGDRIYFQVLSDSDRSDYDGVSITEALELLEKK